MVEAGALCRNVAATRMHTAGGCVAVERQEKAGILRINQLFSDCCIPRQRFDHVSVDKDFGDVIATLAAGS